MFMDHTKDGLLFVQGEEIFFQIEPTEGGVAITECPEGEPLAVFATVEEAVAAYDSCPIGVTVFDFRKKIKEHNDGRTNSL